MLESIDLGKIFMSKPERDEATSSCSLSVFVPIYNNHYGANDTTQSRRKHFNGFLRALIDSSKMIAWAIEGQRLDRVDFTLSDEAHGSVIVLGQVKDSELVMTCATRKHARLSYDSTISICGRQWNLQFYPGQYFRTKQSQFQSYLVGGWVLG